MGTLDAHDTETIYTERSVLDIFGLLHECPTLARTGLIFAVGKGRAWLGHGGCSISPQVIAGVVGEGSLPSE